MSAEAWGTVEGREAESDRGPTDAPRLATDERRDRLRLRAMDGASETRVLWGRIVGGVFDAMIIARKEEEMSVRPAQLGR